jgi:anti-sigma factor RsiW
VSRSPESPVCDSIQNDLETYLDGAVSSERVQQIEAHLQDCHVCMTQIHLAKEIQNELRALPELDAPAPVIQSISDQTARSAKPRPSLAVLLDRWSRPAWATLALACLALVVGLVVLNQGSTVPEQPDEAAIAQATAEARYALAQVGFATRKAGVAVRDRALRDHLVNPTQESISQALRRNGQDASGNLVQGVNDV